MPDEGKKILKYNYGERSIRVLFIVYADLECLLEKMHSCQNNPENPYTEKKKLSIRPMVIYCLQIVHLIQLKISLIVTEAKICKDLEKFCKDLRKHAMRVFNYEEKK